MIIRRKSNLRRSRTAENLMEPDDSVTNNISSPRPQISFTENSPSPRIINIPISPDRQSPRAQYEQKFKIEETPPPHPKYIDKSLAKLMTPERRSSDPAIVKDRKISLDSDTTKRTSTDSPYQTPNGSPEITRRIHRKRTGSNLSSSEIFRDDKILKEDKERKENKKEKKEKKRKQEKFKEKAFPPTSPASSPQHTAPITIRHNMLMEMDHFSWS